MFQICFEKHDYKVKEGWGERAAGEWNKKKASQEDGQQPVCFFRFCFLVFFFHKDISDHATERLAKFQKPWLWSF